MLKYKIKTELSKDAVIKKISELLLEKNLLAGNISNEKFKIRRIPRLFVRNAFLPVFEGKIEERDSGCIVSVKARLYHFTSIILAIWLLVFGFGLFVFPGEKLMILAAIAIVIIVMTLGFFIPATQVIKKIKSVLS